MQVRRAEKVWPRRWWWWPRRVAPAMEGVVVTGGGTLASPPIVPPPTERGNAPEAAVPRKPGGTGDRGSRPL